MAAHLVHTAESEVLHSEILWLLSFGWSWENIAQRLRISTSAVEKHVTGRDPGPHARAR